VADKTKTVSGKELTASDFAYVGDANDPSTWSLPVHDKSHIQDALARFNQTDLPADKKTAVAKKLASKARGAGIDPSGFEKENVKSSEHADFGNGWVEIFRAGDYGEKGNFSADDLDRVVSSYDPTNHEAPACIGHPADDKPAYGWVDSLMRQGKTLLAKFREVDPGFESLVKDGKFKKRSAAFYLGDDGNISGLRHVAFLGAQPPEVKGLKNLNFNDDKGRTFKSVDFDEEEPVADKTIAEQVRDAVASFFAEHFGKRSEAKTFSESDAQALATRAAEQATKPLQEKITKLEGDLATQATRFSERESKIATAETRQRAVEAVNKLKSTGRWVPAFEKMGLPLVFDELAKVTTTVEFGEGDKKKQTSPLEILTQFLEGLPKIVPDGRTFTGGAPGSKTGTTRFTEGKGVQADPNSIALNDQATKRAKEKNISFSEALDQIVAEHPELAVPGGSQAGAV
jgi:hypothetical protein